MADLACFVADDVCWCAPCMDDMPVFCGFDHMGDNYNYLEDGGLCGSGGITGKKGEPFNCKPSFRYLY